MTYFICKTRCCRYLYFKHLHNNIVSFFLFFFFLWLFQFFFMPQTKPNDRNKMEMQMLISNWFLGFDYLLFSVLVATSLKEDVTQLSVLFVAVVRSFVAKLSSSQTHTHTLLTCTSLPFFTKIFSHFAFAFFILLFFCPFVCSKFFSVFLSLVSYQIARKDG